MRRALATRRVLSSDVHAGAPIDLFPLQDDPAAGADPKQNNNFRYDFPDDPTTQDRCPFAAHTRKTNPRADLENLNGVSNPTATESRRIIRRGVQFGPEVTPEEAASGETKHGRCATCSPVYRMRVTLT